MTNFKKLMIVAVSSVSVFALTPSASAETVSIFDGLYGSSSDYIPFFNSEGYTTKNIAANFSATDLTGSKLVVLSALNGVNASQISALSTYVNGGGRLFVAGDAKGFEFTQTSLNAVSVGIGSSISIMNGSYDSGFQTTSTIAATPFTAGVNNIKYAYTASLAGGTNLVTGLSGQSIVRYQQIGSGYFFAAADTNLQNSLSDPSVGNGQLFRNFATVDASAVPEPATWAMMLVGIGMMGFAMRRSRKSKINTTVSFA